MVPLLTPESFRSLDAPLTLDVRIDDGEPFVLELHVISVVARSSHRYREEPFTVSLSGPAQPVLPQRTYRLKHPALGSIDLFLVPVRQAAGSTEYEAVFN